MTLSRRLLLSASIVLFVFLGVTGLVLDRAFYHSTEDAVRERLKGQIYALLAAADFNEQQQRLNLSEPLPDPRLSSPQSGLYASIYDSSGNSVWRSQSAITLSLPRYTDDEIAKWYFQRLTDDAGAEYFSQSFTVAWESSQGRLNRYVFQVLENHHLFNQQVSRFRSELWGWLLGVSIILLLTQGIILRWSLKPLRDVALDLDRVKAGESERLRENYPGEIQGLTAGINTFIDSERAQRDRYRHTLADLAHSLKTPLAVLKSGLNDRIDTAGLANMHEQIDRMKQIVDYQLQRASAAGRTTLGVSVPLQENLERIVTSLNKVYADKRIQCDIDMDKSLQFPGEEGDLLELAGNLLENAFKWAGRHIRVSATQQQADGNQSLKMLVEDDGGGIPESMRNEVLQRGRRADENVSGHGIGLSVVMEIVNVYGGSFTISTSPSLKGACMIIEIPYG